MSIEKNNASIFLCRLQYNGLKLKPALEYCRHHHSIIGLSTGPMTKEGMEELRDMDDEERRGAFFLLRKKLQSSSRKALIAK